MLCPTHMKYFNDRKYLVSGAYETYELIKIGTENKRVCKACAKKIHEEREKEHGIQY